jgi:hypothetical protein
LVKRQLILIAAALCIFSAVPASAQSWGQPGSTGIVDEASLTLYEVNNATLKFKSTQTGTIVARYPLGGVSVAEPDWSEWELSYSGPGVSAKLMKVYACGGYVEQVASFGPTTIDNTCDGVDVSSVYWDIEYNSYYVEVTLTRSSTSTNPQFHHVQLR